MRRPDDRPSLREHLRREVDPTHPLPELVHYRDLLGHVPHGGRIKFLLKWATWRDPGVFFPVDWPYQPGPGDRSANGGCSNGPRGEIQEVIPRLNGVARTFFFWSFRTNRFKGCLTSPRQPLRWFVNALCSHELPYSLAAFCPSQRHMSRFKCPLPEGRPHTPLATLTCCHLGAVRFRWICVVGSRADLAWFH